jgi:nucleoside-diphosphate-sugar epimerase
MLAGATGFIGSHLADAIEAAGHTLLWRAIRRARAVARNAAGRRSDGGSAQIFLQMAALPVIPVRKAPVPYSRSTSTICLHWSCA